METSTTSQPQRGAFIAGLGAWLQLAQVIGVLSTGLAMIGALKSLDHGRTPGPFQLSHIFGEVFIFAAAGITLSLIGIVLVTIAITACRYRAVWMWHFLCVYGLGILYGNVCLIYVGQLAVMFYLPVSLFFLIFAVVKKDEFQRATPHRPLPASHRLDK